MSVQGAFLSMMVSRAISLVAMVVAIAALGRLLDAQAFGQFALLMAVFTMAKLLSEFGLRSYLIRTAGLTRRDLAEATGLSLAIASGICVLWLGATMVLPERIMSPEQAHATVPLVLALMLVALTLGTEMRLHRSLDFALISRIEVARVVADAGLAIALAAAGVGVAALAWGVFAGQLVFCLVLLTRGTAGGRIWPRRGAWRGYSRFGARMTSTQILPAAGEIAVTAVVTGLLGAAIMGVLNRAQTVHKIIDRTLFEAILPVVLPAMSSALARGVPPMDLYAKQIAYLVAICWPGFALIALLADPLVMVLLGRDWAAAVPAVQILAAAGLGLPFTKMTAKFFVATGLEGPYLRISIVAQMVQVCLVVAGSMVSFEMVCFALVAATYWKALHVASSVRRHVGPMGAHRLRTARQGAALTLGALVGPALILALGLAPLVTLLIALPLAGAGWLAALFAVGHPLAAELGDMKANLRGARP